MAQSAATAQTVEAYVGETMDNAPMGRLHWQVLALVASGAVRVVDGHCVLDGPPEENGRMLLSL